MKLIIPLLPLLIFFSACKDQDEIFEEIGAIDYIHLLRTNQYESNRMPKFNPSDIPFFLKFRNDPQLIQNFPRNPISSFMNEEVRLGVIVLWTIESIRTSGLNPNVHPFDRYPSLNPAIFKKSTHMSLLPDEHEDFKKVADAYYNWWHSDSDFESIKQVDPLSGTDYQWQ